MKKTVLVVAFVALNVSIIFTGCNTPAQKVANAQENVNDANKDLIKANEEYLSDVESYRRETARKIEENDKIIAEFKARKASDKREMNAEYKEKIKSLENKNTDMKKRMDDYQVEGKANWEKFKTEFGHDMDELGKSFKDFTVKNVK